MKKVCVIGYGYWGKNIARVFNESPTFELSAVCEADPKARALAAKLYPQVELLDSFESIGPEISVVAIVTPTNTHFELAKHCLERGFHVFITKPMTRTYEQTEELFALARKKNLMLWADHTFVFNPAVRKLKENLPRIGRPLLLISQRLNLGLYQPDVNVIYDLMPHDLSIACFLFDNVITKATTFAHAAAGLPQEDVAHTSFELENGVHGLITVSWLSPQKVRQFFVVGTDGMLCYDDVEVAEKVKFYDKGLSFEQLSRPGDPQSYTSQVSYRSGDMFSPAVPNTEALKFELEEFARTFEDPTLQSYYENLNNGVMKSLSTVVNSRGQAS